MLIRNASIGRFFRKSLIYDNDIQSIVALIIL